MAFLCLIAMTISPFAQATQSAYAHQEPDVLRTLMNRADSRADSLLVRYRLYPLTEEETLLNDLPTSLSDGTAREYALLAGLWAYRAGEASVFSMIPYGRRSTQLLDRARERDADAPFALLVEGQSLLYRPSFVGGDPGAAVECFTRLATVVDEDGSSGITRTEARVWQWLALRNADRDEEAETLRSELQATELAPLYKQFVHDPPNV